jgi:hypothetical protein
MVILYICIALCFIADAKPALAYIDPNTGGYVFQFLFPVFAAVLAGYIFCKNYIKRLISRIASLFCKKAKK